MHESPEQSNMSSGRHTPKPVEDRRSAGVGVRSAARLSAGCHLTESMQKTFNAKAQRSEDARKMDKAAGKQCDTTWCVGVACVTPQVSASQLCAFASWRLCVEFQLNGSGLAARERREHKEGFFPLRSLRSFAAIVFLVVFSSVALADDVITNVMSPIVSYQYPDDFNSAALTNGGISSPIVSYQFFEWPGDDVLRLWSSPRVSYFYPGNDTTPINLQGRVTDTSGAPLPGATLSVAFGILPVAAASTDANGNFTLPLGAGLYALTATASGHAKSSRVLTLSAGTAAQNFQLASLPAAPGQQNVNRSPTVTYTTGPLGSSLKVFDGTQFVPITAGNIPPSDRMTIVLTHGWINPLLAGPAGIDDWPKTLAAVLRANGITANDANIVGWDWGTAATGFLPPENNVPSQGVALGQALQSVLGAGYANNLHFMGHSLGALVNAATANYLHGDRTAQQPVSPTPWSPARTHITLFDQAEISRVASVQVLFDGLTLNLTSPAAVLKYAAKTLQGWKPSMPVQSAWADNYISLVGFYLPNTLNVALQKAVGLVGPIGAHSYPMAWYDQSIANPTASPLGFKRSHEYAQLPGANLPFPPSIGDLSLGDAYHQTPSASYQLALEPLPPQDLFQLIVPLFGNGADAVVQGVDGTIQFVGDVATEVKDAAVQTGEHIKQGFDYAANKALEGGQAVVNLYDSAVLRLRLHTTPPPPPLNLRFLGNGLQPRNLEGPTQPMAWLPILISSNAVAMAFDFMVEGDPVNDSLVCGLGQSNLFSIEAKFIPTNTMSASRLIDMSAWAGTTNELFFGFMGGTSTNATLIIENIRFYSVAQPRLEISVSGNVTLLSWPLTAGGYVVETSPTLAPPAWEAVSNAPAISADRYILTNSWSDQSRFFRLRQQ